MSQQSVELIIGRLATNPGLRRSFTLQPEVAIREFIAEGHQLTPVEIQALLVIDLEALQRLADRMDPRIQRATLGRSNS